MYDVKRLMLIFCKRSPPIHTRLRITNDEQKDTKKGKGKAHMHY